ncbi:MAG: VOC family protein [Actinomycetota bacterium]|nr:VOC family protein [Actinomycetota bacterium]
MTSGVVGFDHVAITAPEELLDEVLDWYVRCLNLDRIEKPEGTRAGGGWFRAGAQEVHVTVDPHNPPRSAHFAVVVDDFAGLVEGLRVAGSHMEQASAIPGRHRCYTRDPAGNRVEIVAYDEPKAIVSYEERSEERT